MATSTNFGNMFSMAGASLFLPFLPLLPTQILLTNVLTDLPEMTIATDSVDAESVEQRRRWDVHFLRRFMVVFGLVSSLFDYLTFGVLLYVLHATPGQFRTGWFMESVISASLIVLVVRTRKPFYKSKISRPLLIAMILVLLITFALPYSPLSELLGLRPLTFSSMMLLGMITLLYVAASEVAKRIFLRKIAKDRPKHLLARPKSKWRFRHGPCPT